MTVPAIAEKKEEVNVDQQHEQPTESDALLSQLRKDHPTPDDTVDENPPPRPGAGDDETPPAEGDEDGAAPPAKPAKPAKPAESDPLDDPELARDLPDFGGDDRLKRHFLHERLQRKKEREDFDAALKEQQTKFEERLAKLEGTGAAAPAAGDDPGPITAPELANVLGKRALAQRVLDGDITLQGQMSEEEANRVMNLSSIVLSGVQDDAVVLQVIEDARAGKLGENGASIAELAQGELGLVQARARRAQADRTARDGQQAEQLGKLNDAIMEQVAAWPELAPKEEGKNTPEFDFTMQWLATNVGTPDKQGPYFGLAYEDPTKVAGLFAQIKTAWKAHEGEAAREELAALKARQLRDESRHGPLEDGSQAGEDGGEPTGSAATLSKLQARNPGMMDD